MLMPEVQQRARHRLLVFGGFNSASFTLLTGNLISLYLIRLGAGNTLLGIVAAIEYIAFFFLLVGKQFVPRVGVMRVFAWAWLIRYIAVIPMLLAPVVIAPPLGPTAAFALVVIGALGFHAARGVGIVANAPMFSGFAEQDGRGRLLSQFQMIFAVVGIAGGAAVAWLLGPEASLGAYVLFLSTGVALGFVATAIVFSLPELDAASRSARTSFLVVLNDALNTPDLRRFFVIFLLISTVVAVGRGFMVVYAKQAQGLGDNAAFWLVAIGNVGNLLSGYLGSILLDRLGAKPMISFWLLTYIVSLLLAIVAPAAAGLSISVLLGAIFWIGSLGFNGSQNTAQAYFLGITTEEQRLPLGIWYFIVFGAGGAVGSFAAGGILDLLQEVPGVSTVTSFRILFAIVAALAGVALLGVNRLPALGAASFRGTVGVLFSLRDLRAAALLSQLDRSTTEHAETRAIQELAQSGSHLPIERVLHRLGSPSFRIRYQTLEALDRLPYTERVEAALIRHLDDAPHTTARFAARILGRRGSDAAARALWRAFGSDDRMLAAEVGVALARLRDHDAVTRLAARVRSSDDNTLVLYAAIGLQIAGSGDDQLMTIIDRLSVGDLPGYVADELVLAAAEIIGMTAWFYPLFRRFALGEDAVAGLTPYLGTAAPAALYRTVALIPGDPAAALTALAHPLRASPDRRLAAVDVAAVTPRPRTVFLLAAWSIHALRVERGDEISDVGGVRKQQHDSE